ncbi:hypothetical protein OUZ56_016459 [Daphnia magna]|uniref:Uncharacterized protein n=1 Tax=Daphnia magna TaxID=35525 RepID=A0ABR0AQM1_9CRUS|nr:hypothetical protein OUZ56_016459 [Daphnia magna]
MKLFFKTQKKKSIPKVKSDSLIDVDGGTGLKQLHQRNGKSFSKFTGIGAVRKLDYNFKVTINPVFKPRHYPVSSSFILVIIYPRLHPASSSSSLVIIQFLLHPASSLSSLLIIKSQAYVSVLASQIYPLVRNKDHD